MKIPELHGFRIYATEPLSETFIRVILEQLDLSLLLCQRYPGEPDYVTHEIRKSAKRIRAIYRLFRLAAGNDVLLEVKELHGRLSKLLAAHRVSKANLETMSLIAAYKRLRINSAFLENQIALMQREHSRLTQSFFQDGINLQVKNLIVTAQERLLATPEFPCTFDDLAAGMRTTYDQGRKNLQLAIRHPDTESLHNLRKTVKSLWNHMILLRPMWPTTIGPFVHQLDLLAEKLGKEHDLAELMQYLSLDKSETDEEQRSAVMDFIFLKRKQIQKTIIPQALRLYAEKPGALVRRMKVYDKLFSLISYSPIPHSKYVSP